MDFLFNAAGFVEQPQPKKVRCSAEPCPSLTGVTIAASRDRVAHESWLAPGPVAVTTHLFNFL